MLIPLSKILNTTTDFLFGINTCKNSESITEFGQHSLSANEVKFIKKYRHLSTDRKQRIENQLNFEIEQFKGKESAPLGSDKMKLYENIKIRRKALKFSQEELAKKLGYKSTSTIAKIEAGKIDLPQSKIKAFADVLETTPSALMGWDYEQEFISEKLSNPSGFFALKINDDSMAPFIQKDDIALAIFKNQLADNEVAVVTIGNENATLRKIIYTKDGIIIYGTNIANFMPIFYSNDEIDTLPIKILGQVVEIRRKL